MNLSHLPPELVLKIYLEVPYDEVLRPVYLQSVDMILNSTYYWVQRAKQELNISPDTFHHRSVIESYLDYPRGLWARWRYVELISRRGVNSDSLSFLNFSEALRRAVRYNNIPLVMKWQSMVSHNFLFRTLMAGQAAQYGHEELFRTFALPGIKDIEYQLGYGHHPRILKRYQELTGKQVTDHRNYQLGLIASTGQISSEVELKIAVCGLIEFGNVERLKDFVSSIDSYQFINVFDGTIETATSIKRAPTMAVFDYAISQLIHYGSQFDVAIHKLTFMNEMIKSGNVDLFIDGRYPDLEDPLGQCSLYNVSYSPYALEVVEWLHRYYPTQLAQIIKSYSIFDRITLGISSLAVKEYLIKERARLKCRSI